MCTGVEPALMGKLALAASVASTAGGTYMQMQSQDKAQKRIKSQLAQTAEQNEQLQRQSQAAAFDALESFEPERFEEIQAEETGNIKRNLLQSLSGGELPGEYGGRRSENTQRFIEAQTEEASDFSEKMAEALANLRGFEGGIRRGGRGITTAGERSAMGRGFQAGNTALLPGQIESIKASAQNPLADLMAEVGSVGTSAYLPAATGGGTGDIIWDTPPKTPPLPVKRPTNFNLA